MSYITSAIRTVLVLVHKFNNRVVQAAASEKQNSEGETKATSHFA